MDIDNLREDFNELEIVQVNDGSIMDVNGFIYFENPYSVDMKQCEAYLAMRELEKIYYSSLEQDNAYNMICVINAMCNETLVDKLDELKQAQNIHQIYRITNGE